MIAITDLGDSGVLLPVAGLILLSLLWLHTKRTAFWWASTWVCRGGWVWVWYGVKGGVGGAPATGGDGDGSRDSPAGDLGEDLLGGSGPDEWLRVVVAGFQVVLDSGDEVIHAVEHSPADGLFG